jgi:dihydrofolate synthase/folylpolyglutamate synthase
LDATNVVTPLVSVITSLSYDHMAVLGYTLALIAGEKAGIIKTGIPVISSPQTEEAAAVLDQVAKERHAPLTVVGRDISFAAGQQSLDGQTLTVQSKREGDTHPESVILHLPLLGRHQVVNAATAYAALKASNLNVSTEAIKKGFAEVYWPCRFEIVRREPPVILDSAHNQDSFEKLDQTLEELFPGVPVILIFGSSEDKNVEVMLATLAKRLKLVLATKAVHPRAIEPVDIVATAERLKLRAEAVNPVQAALVQALDLAAGHGEIVLSAGSMFVTAEVKRAWEELQ